MNLKHGQNAPNLGACVINQDEEVVDNVPVVDRVCQQGCKSSAGETGLHHLVNCPIIFCTDLHLPQPGPTFAGPLNCNPLSSQASEVC